jgi:SNF2 family DNA or RNA helicase
MSFPDGRACLDSLGAAIGRFLARHLPELGEDWWEFGVLPSLTDRELRAVRSSDVSSLGQLDIATLSRLVNANWEFLQSRCQLGNEFRDRLGALESALFRLSRSSLDDRPNPEEAFDDLDALARVAEALDPGSIDTEALLSARAAAFGALTDWQDGSSAQSLGEIGPGSKIRLRARPEVVAVVTEVVRTGREAQFKVFQDGSERAYYESQIEPFGSEDPAPVDPDLMRASITALKLLEPASTHLYSFNSGRIDYEPYQFRPVMKLISSDRPRLLIADDVGVGKTIEAGLIIKELQARQSLESILVICPKQLVVEGKWRQELKRFDEDFVELDSSTLRHCLEETRLEGRWPSRYRKAILPYSLLDERLLLGAGEGRQKRLGLLSLEPPAKFDLVVVDEAHHVRNKETWRHRVVKHLLDSAEAAVLISATPIQTGSNDLFNLLQLLRPDLLIGAREFERMREPNVFLALAEENIRRGGPSWQTEAIQGLEAALGTTWGSAVLRADPRAAATRDLLERAGPDPEERVLALRAIQALNTFSGMVNRTRRRDIGSFTTRNPETVEVDFTDEQGVVHRQLLSLCARILAVRQPSTSIDFLLSTLQRQASSCINGLGPFMADLLESRLSAEELSEAGLEGEWSALDWVSEFRTEIRELSEKAARLDDDPKLDALMSIIDEKRQLENNKLLVFSTFRHTLHYLLPRLQSAGVRVGLVHGGVDDRDRRDIRARFALDKSEHEAIDVLLSSEVGTEGLDNQFCDALVNYDIPWNPMRIEQRIGRIDRRGQKSEAISIKNMVVRGTVDARVYGRCLERIGVFRQSLGGSEEILGELTREMRAIAEDLTLTESQQDERLQQLADNKLARIREQSELEEREGALFGLAVQRFDDEGVQAAADDWLSPPQLSRLVVRYLSDRGIAEPDRLFDRRVAVIRPDKATRSALLSDARGLGSPDATTSWVRWLEADGSRRLTFDPRLADEDGIELLSPTHALVRAAARHIGHAAHGARVALRVRSTDLPRGRHPFAVHSWSFLGARDFHEVRILTHEGTSADVIERLLMEAEAGEARLSEDASDHLDELHYDMWAELRSTHIERTRTFIAAQLASIRLSHHGRVAQLEDQMAEASHPNIRRMRESELRISNDEFQRRCNELESAIERCDVTSTKIFSGVLEVN